MDRGGVGGARPAPTGDEFAGFRSSDEVTMVPRVFFSRLLPGIEKPEELVVTLYLFYLHGRSRRWPRMFTERQLAADAGLMRALSNLSELTPEGALAVGLSLAVSRGTVNRVAVQEAGRPGEAYLLNIPANRRAIERLQGTELRLDEPPPPAAPAEAPNIFALYEENIGAITPLIADELKDAEERYPPQWIEKALREAVSLNKRSWRYIEAILRHYEAEGPGNEEAGRDTEADWLERRYARGKRGSGRLR